MTVIHNPPNKLVIDNLWIVVSVDDQGNEGVVAAPMVNGLFSMPLIAADPERLKDIMQWGEMLAKTKAFTGKQVRLIKMTTREVVKELGHAHH